ncbi:MAG: ABC transporter ATP-binding protein [Bacteroidetes bacterium GWC2_33_15]|nr:MAG: ABC transporter ATP-binding protein [Bacteroidetes bacterium GWA2_33_15]OFX52378.1 MAG: ABC transporter ATP-binding protein [Bacteroidetes bacterium GWC2_33_15]OFX64527.1 MAG: ABC transporter ATP-binding protein [Bacteroidetes bacterium GWB2_32_14]OFX68937.1 MAG: ABC transporter ATP-binding protein [Bacteroidetes bacterium GWD2_33_33]
MDLQLKDFLQYIETAKAELNIQRQMAFLLECNVLTLDIIDKSIAISDRIKTIASDKSYKINYLNQYRSNIDSILNAIPLRGQKNPDIVNQQAEDWRKQVKQQFENNTVQVSNLYQQLIFNIDFFDKIGFFNSNVVAIGANGSGKTTLSNKFKTYLQNNGVVISAQRILLVPRLDTIANPSKTASELKQSQTRDKTNKNTDEFSYLQQEFGVVLKNLLADNIAAGNSYRKKSLELAKHGQQPELPDFTNLDKTFQIWNALIEHRTIDCEDGINITAESDDGRSYPAIQMSDGEKVMLYLIGQVLQAPKDGFIVIDEPEMYLHKTILKKLWDILEKERQDCLFIYLTHDLDFATSRATAKKIWIKSFIHPDKWEIEDIPTDEIPETLLFELLGSRKNILFCEGQKGSIDERVFSILFPELTIMPVGTCFDVINHTKAFNKLTSVNTSAIGLIDSDHHDSSRLDSLKDDKIYSFSISEVENLFLDEQFIKKMATQLLVDIAEIEKIKADIIAELDKLKIIQASNYVSTKINYYFKDSHVSKGNSLEQVESNFQTFYDKIEITNWHNTRVDELNNIVSSKDYKKTITVFNNKGLRSIAMKYLKISDFTERSIKLLLSDTEAQDILIDYYPDEVKTAGNTRYS